MRPSAAHTEASPPSWRTASAWLPHLLIVLLVAVIWWLAENRPTLYQILMEEDGWAEWATFLAFLVAGAGAAFLAVRFRRRRIETLAFAGLALFCFFVAGEEVSWGQRLLGYRPAEIFLENNYQQEANLHNLVNDFLDVRWMVFAIAVLYGILAPLASRWAGLPREFAPPLALLPWFTFVAVAVFRSPYLYTAELLELVLGALFLADVAERRARVRGGNGAMTGTLAQLWVLAGAVLFVPVANAITVRHAEELVPAARQELRAFQFDLAQPGVIQPQLIHTGVVHKRMFGAVEREYLSWPEEDVLLDPWNQSYWFLWTRTGERSARILVYSYGPNRRRDTDVLWLLSSPGSMERLLQKDDLGIVLELEAPLGPGG